jgi:hypothetical protein
MKPKHKMQEKWLTYSSKFFSNLPPFGESRSPFSKFESGNRRMLLIPDPYEFD